MATRFNTKNHSTTMSKSFNKTIIRDFPKATIVYRTEKLGLIRW